MKTLARNLAAHLICLGLLLGAEAQAQAQAQADNPTYQLNCVPASSDSMLPEKIRARLDLHGWQESEHGARYQLCFRQMERQQLLASPNMAPYAYGPYGAVYNNSPNVQVVMIPYLDLSATRADGTVWQAQQDLPDGERPAQRLEQALRLLIERLPQE